MVAARNGRLPIPGVKDVRGIKAFTALAVLMFIGNAVVFHSIATKGYRGTIDALHPTFGSADSLVLAFISVISLVSIPAIALIGVFGVACAKRFGRPALVCGLLCCVMSAASFVLWKKYGGAPGPSAPNGPTPVTRQATPAPTQHPASKAPSP